MQSQKKLKLFLLIVSSLCYFVAVIFISKYVADDALHQVRNQAKLQFERQSVALFQQFEKHFQSHVNAVYGAQALFAASDSVSAEEWAAYIRQLDLPNRFPGISSMAYVDAIKQSEKESFLKKIRTDSSVISLQKPDFTIYPTASEADLFVITFNEPLIESGRLLGFNMASDKGRKQTLEAVRDQNILLATPVSDSPVQRDKVFSIALPVYKNGLPIRTVQERRAALEGFVIAGFLQGSFFEKIFTNHQADNISFQIYEEVGNEKLLLYSQSEAGNKKSNLTLEQSLNMAGRIWKIEFQGNSSTVIDNWDAQTWPLFFGVGTVIGTLLYAVIFFLISTRARATRLANVMTKSLKESEERFRIAAQNANDLVYEWDIKNNTVMWFGNIDQDLGYNPNEFPRTMEAFENSVHPDDKARVADGITKQLQQNIPYREELRIKKKDGTYAVWVDRGCAIRDANGIAYKWVGTVTDITKQKETDEQIKKRNQELEQLNQLMVGRELKMSELKKEITTLKKSTS